MGAPIGTNPGGGAVPGLLPDIGGTVTPSAGITPEPPALGLPFGAGTTFPRVGPGMGPGIAPGMGPGMPPYRLGRGIPFGDFTLIGEFGSVGTGGA